MLKGIRAFALDKLVEDAKVCVLGASGLNGIAKLNRAEKKTGGLQ